MPAADDPPGSDTGPDADPAKLTGTALLEHVSRKLAAQRPAPRAKPLFRVVEVARDPRGRLSAQGQVWHSDLDHVRRFGHALGANSAAQKVLIADGRGAVLEQIPVRPAHGPAPGWSGWRERPLPPLPPRPRPAKPAAVAAPGTPPAPPAPASTTKPLLRPPREIPVVEQVKFDPEATATFAPAPPP